MIRVFTDNPHSASLMIGGGTVVTGKLVTGSMVITSSPVLVSLKTDLSGVLVVVVVVVVVALE